MKKHPDSLAAVEMLFGDDEGKCMWKFDGINGKGEGMDGSGKCSRKSSLPETSY